MLLMLLTALLARRVLRVSPVAREDRRKLLDQVGEVERLAVALPDLGVADGRLEQVAVLLDPFLEIERCELHGVTPRWQCTSTRWRWASASCALPPSCGRAGPWRSTRPRAGCRRGSRLSCR